MYIASFDLLEAINMIRELPVNLLYSVKRKEFQDCAINWLINLHPEIERPA